MSWYYNYYLGYIDKKDGKIYPLGLFDNKGKIHPVFSRSRTFASDFFEDFSVVEWSKVSQELVKTFYLNENDNDFPSEGNNREYVNRYAMSYLPLSDLTCKSFIKSGFCLIKDIEAYLSDQQDDWGAAEDLKYNMLSSEAFAIRASAEAKGYKGEGSDEDDEYHSCAEYAYFSFPDYYCKEYEAFLLRQAASAYEDYDYEIVILKTEG